VIVEPDASVPSRDELLVESDIAAGRAADHGADVDGKPPIACALWRKDLERGHIQVSLRNRGLEIKQATGPRTLETGNPQPRFFRLPRPVSCCLFDFEVPVSRLHPASTQISPASASTTTTIAA
jgi:hypothetical protein